MDKISISFDEMKAKMLEDEEFKSEYEKLKSIYKDIEESIKQSQN